MHFASYYRWLVFQHLFGTPDRSSALLDIGCDDGGFVERMSVQRHVAVDVSLQSLRKACTHLRICGDGTRLPLREVLFDLVMLSDVIEHVIDDQRLVAGVCAHVRPGGALWLSTTADKFRLFPIAITPRAERSWGHVRKGYTVERLVELIGADFACTSVIWPEIMFRQNYLLMWLCAKRMPNVASRLARLCFLVDSKITHIQERYGHIYIRAIRDHEQLRDSRYAWKVTDLGGDLDHHP